jgi:acetyl esterase/lipase
MPRNALLVLRALLIAALAAAGCGTVPQVAPTATVALPPWTPYAAPTPLPTLTASTTPAPTETSTPPQVFSDLSYAGLSESQRLDLYIPAGGGPFPLVIYVHGGGWILGDKLEPYSNGIADFLVQRGFGFASLNYRLSDEAKFPAQVHDVKAAVRWLRAHADEFALDPNRFAAWGDSAGGNLVAMLGTSCRVATLEGSELGSPEQSSCVQAVVDWFGPMDFLKIDAQFAGTTCPQNHSQGNSIESDYLGTPILKAQELVMAANPVTYISSDEPPFLIQHGTADCVVPLQQSQQLYDALAAANDPGKMVLNTLQGAAHGGAEFQSPANLGFVLAFLQMHLR